MKRKSQADSLPQPHFQRYVVPLFFEPYNRLTNPFDQLTIGRLGKYPFPLQLLINLEEGIKGSLFQFREFLLSEKLVLCCSLLLDRH